MLAKIPKCCCLRKLFSVNKISKATLARPTAKRFLIWAILLLSAKLLFGHPKWFLTPVAYYFNATKFHTKINVVFLKLNGTRVIAELVLFLPATAKAVESFSRRGWVTPVVAHRSSRSKNKLSAGHRVKGLNYGFSLNIHNQLRQSIVHRTAKGAFRHRTLFSLAALSFRTVGCCCILSSATTSVSPRPWRTVQKLY